MELISSLTFLDSLEMLNLFLVILGGLLAFRVFQRLRGGKMASGILLVLAAGGVFAIHEGVHVFFEWIWPQPWHGIAYDVSETLFIIVFVLAMFQLSRSLPKDVKISNVSKK